MTARRPVRTLLGAVLALACALTVLTLGTAAPEPATPQLETAADLSQFDPGNIITDAVFHDSGSMTAAEIQSFLDAKGAGCRQDSGDPPCLKDYVQTTSTRDADSFCTGRYAGARESAAAIIKKVAVACDISPRVLLVTLQKEMGFITSGGPTWKMYTRAMGMGCPDNTGGTCDSQYNGFFNQLYSASKQFQRYRANPTRYGHVPSMWNSVRYHPNSACGSSRVFIENQSTASLYNYTPYQPNKAALAAGYGTGNSCSAYGNRNFYNYFTDWFGSTQNGGRDVDAPVGRLEAVVDKGGSVLVRGWAFDPDSPASAVQVNVFAGSTKIGTDVTDQTRTDVAETNHGAGSRQGFEAKLAVAPGRHTVCVYAINIGEGYSNPRLGCAALTVTTEASWNPKGRVADVRVAGTRLVVEGWAFDPDAVTRPATVRVYAGSLRLGDLLADDPWADVAEYYPAAGSEHGFKLDTRLTAGTHRICVYAFNKGTGTANPQLGCRTVTVTAPPLREPITTGDPIGRLADVELTGQDVSIDGWSFDPDAATAPATVRVLAGGKLLDTVVASRDWPDVQKYFPYAGSAHRFAWRGILPHGSYDLCVEGVDEGAGADRRIGCQAVTVVGDPKANPKGGLRIAEVTGRDVRIAGWSFDPDAPTEPVRVRIWNGAQMLAELTADGEWPDVGKVYPYAGSAHGYDWTGELPPGEHQICVWAFNIDYGTANPRLGCATVTVVGAAEAEDRELVGPEGDGTTPVQSSSPTSGAQQGSQDGGPTGTSTGTSTETSTSSETSTSPSASSGAVPESATP